MIEIGSLCPACRLAEGNKNSNGIGDTCSQTGMSGQKDMRERCPIISSTDPNCMITGSLPPGFRERWHGPIEERKRIRANRQG